MPDRTLLTDKEIDAAIRAAGVDSLAAIRPHVHGLHMQDQIVITLCSLLRATAGYIGGLRTVVDRENMANDIQDELASIARKYLPPNANPFAPSSN